MICVRGIMFSRICSRRFLRQHIEQDAYKEQWSIKRVVMDLIAGHKTRTLEFPVYHDRSYINKCI